MIYIVSLEDKSNKEIITKIVINDHSETKNTTYDEFSSKEINSDTKIELNSSFCSRNLLKKFTDKAILSLPRSTDNFSKFKIEEMQESIIILGIIEKYHEKFLHHNEDIQRIFTVLLK